jgi:hypothetical protein
VNELVWRGRRIVQIDYAGKEIDCYGFKINQAFKVLDDLDDNALPLVQTWFWSPSDAIAAIEMVDSIVKDKKWPTTAQFEYNYMNMYRRNHDVVYNALKRIREVLDDDLEDEPCKRIRRILDVLHQNMHERRVA